MGRTPPHSHPSDANSPRWHGPDYAHWLAHLTPLSPLRRDNLTADIGAWYAEAGNSRVGGRELLVIDPALVHVSGGARLFEAPQGTVLQLPQQAEALGGTMQAAWLACDGITHHAYVLRRGADGRLTRHCARGEGPERAYTALPVADGWYAFGLDQSARLLIVGAPAAAAEGVVGSHRQLLASLPGLFFGALHVVRGRAVAFTNRAPLYRTSEQLVAQAQALSPALAAARFVAERR